MGRWIKAIGCVLAVIACIMVLYFFAWILVALVTVALVWVIANAQKPRNMANTAQEVREFMQKYSNRK